MALIDLQNRYDPLSSLIGNKNDNNKKELQKESVPEDKQRFEHVNVKNIKLMIKKNS